MSNVFIDSPERLDLVLKSLKIDVIEEERERIVAALYPHLEYTRRKSYHEGYKQGRFDEKIENLYGVPEESKEKDE